MEIVFGSLMNLMEEVNSAEMKLLKISKLSSVIVSLYSYDNVPKIKNLSGDFCCFSKKPIQQRLDNNKLKQTLCSHPSRFLRMHFTLFLLLI